MLQAAAQGAPVYVEWNDQLVDLDYWAIPKGSKNRDAAARLIAFMTDPVRQAAFAEWTYYGPANKKAFEHIDKQKAALMPTSPENLAKGRVVEESWYADHEQEVERRWEAWKME